MAILQSHSDNEERDTNLLQYCHTLMLRAWCTRQRLVCNMHTDRKLFFLFIHLAPSSPGWGKQFTARTVGAATFFNLREACPRTSLCVEVVSGTNTAKGYREVALNYWNNNLGGRTSGPALSFSLGSQTLSAQAVEMVLLDILCHPLWAVATALLALVVLVHYRKIWLEISVKGDVVIF